MSGKRVVMTIATGATPYWSMAVALARSFSHWRADSDISLIIVTDLVHELPGRLNGVTVHRVARGSLGAGFSSKLLVDQLSTADQTLFIDADCLCCGPLDPIFERFAGHSVSVVGGSISEGEWFGDVASVCRVNGISALPKFNGGMYYVERGTRAHAVYGRARHLLHQYDALGLVRLRGQPNDELLMAIAMAQEGCVAIPDDGTIMGDLLASPQVVELDVLRGCVTLRNPRPPHPDHRPWFPLEEVRPAVVHFLGAHVRHWRYRREAVKLQLAIDWKFPYWLAVMLATTFTTPAHFSEFAKSVIRPLYRGIFGIRTVRTGNARF